MARPQIMQDSFYINNTDEPIEYMVPVGETATVSDPNSSYDSSYRVTSKPGAQESIVLHPGERVDLEA